MLDALMIDELSELGVVVVEIARFTVGSKRCFWTVVTVDMVGEAR